MTTPKFSEMAPSGDPSAPCFLQLLDQLRSEYLQERASWHKRIQQLQAENAAQQHQDGAAHRKRSDSIESRLTEFSNVEVPHDGPRAGARTASCYKLRRAWEALPENSTLSYSQDAEVEDGSKSAVVAHSSAPHRASLQLTRFKVPETADVLSCLRERLSQGIVLSPNSNYRFCWDISGMMLIGYDVWSIPMLAFELPRSDFTTWMDWITRLFWTGDMVQSFMVGYYDRGNLVMNRRQIIRHYLVTWFLIDVVVVLTEWGSLVGNSGDSDTEDVSGLGRVFRAARAVRVLRLVRLFKLQRIMYQLQEYIDSEYAFTMVGLVKLMMSILILNHGIACVWFWIGSSTMDSGLINWLEKSGTNGTELAYEYTTSLHWSLTQFTPASMDVSATNVYERTFSIFVLVFAILAFSSIVASITGSMTSIRNAKGEEMKQFWLLRRYLRQRHVSHCLTKRIVRYVEHQVVSQTKLVQASSITLLKALSDPLREELMSAIYSPVLLGHVFFEALVTDTPFILHRLCHCSIITLSLASEDIQFNSGAMAKHAYFVKTGALQYIMEHKLPKEICPGVCVSEPVLWTPWNHRGAFKAALPSELLAIDPQLFATTMASHPKPWHFAKYYAEQFMDILNKVDPSALSDIFDGEEFYKNMVLTSRLKSTLGKSKDMESQPEDQVGHDGGVGKADLNATTTDDFCL